MAKKISLIFLAFLTLSTACWPQDGLAHEHESRHPKPEAIALLQKGYDPRIQANLLETEEKGLEGFITCQVARMEVLGKDPLEGKPSQVVVRSFRPKVLGQLMPEPKTVLIIPPLGGASPLDETYAYSLCALGFRAVVLERWAPNSRDEFDFSAHDRQAVRIISAIRHIVEYIAPTRKNQLGIFGTSAGAIISALAVGFEPRLSAAVLIVGGGGLADLYAYSTESGIAELRKKRMKEFGYGSVAEYHQALKEHILIEPLDFARFSGPKRVLMVIAERDSMVPTANQWALHRAFGSQDALLFSGGHYLAVADALTRRHRDFFTFFNTHLD